MGFDIIMQDDIYASAIWTPLAIRMYKILTRAYAITFLTGMASVAVIIGILQSQGCVPQVHPLFPQETAMLVKVIGKSANLLCLLSAGICTWYAVKQLFVAPSRALRPFLKAATIFSMAFALPLIFGALAQNALGANPFS